MAIMIIEYKNYWSCFVFINISFYFSMSLYVVKNVTSWNVALLNVALWNILSYVDVASSGSGEASFYLTLNPNFIPQHPTLSYWNISKVKLE